ncbi:hypothetical protein E6W39_10320 [Kitasatospora acidiphila]|uniref:Uncharacterized protein n=1 Tax=Kitasatospora acidiphila TaxID=2567942 RepID=A0A540W2L9_9ACTN|nr:hypothetical protein [Kitasatospora acidiphila]TQF02584.1 hypothetical protein E6W39_10320 [Kitasatospora acidiphila]
MTFLTNIKLGVKSSRSCVLYDAEGEIRVVHEEVTLDGAHERADKDLERLTRELSQRQGVDVEGLNTLLHAGALEPGASYRVNVADKSLIRQP